RPATSGNAGERLGGQVACEFQDLQGLVRGECAALAGRFRDGSGFHRIVPGNENPECDGKCSRGVPSDGEGRSDAVLGWATIGAGENKTLACYGGEPDL